MVRTLKEAGISINMHKINIQTGDKFLEGVEQFVYSTFISFGSRQTVVPLFNN